MEHMRDKQKYPPTFATLFLSFFHLFIYLFITCFVLLNCVVFVGKNSWSKKRYSSMERTRGESRWRSGKVCSWCLYRDKCSTTTIPVSGMSLLFHILFFSLLCASFSSLCRSIQRFRALNTAIIIQRHGHASRACTGNLLFHSLSYFFIIIFYSPILITSNNIP